MSRIARGDLDAALREAELEPAGWSRGTALSPRFDLPEGNENKPTRRLSS